MSILLIPDNVCDSYRIEEQHHACAVLKTEFPAEWKDLLAALEQLRLPKSRIVAKGGGKSQISQGINGFFARRGLRERKFDIQVLVDGTATLSPTHHVDYFKNRVATETEWNNKDPFYDRALTTFRLWS